MRLAHLDVHTLEADVLQPLPDLGPFDSIGLNYAQHRLPGPMSHKAHAVASLAAVLRPDGVLFGATVLGEPHVHTRLSRLAMRVNNRRGLFDNLTDTATGLQRILNASFVPSGLSWSAPSRSSPPTHPTNGNSCRAEATRVPPDPTPRGRPLQG